MGAKKGRPKPIGSGRQKGSTNKVLLKKYNAQAKSIELDNKMRELEISEREMLLDIKRRQYQAFLKTEPRLDGELAEVVGREFFSTRKEFADCAMKGDATADKLHPPEQFSTD